MAKIGFISLGCAKNQVDCERMMYRVREAGHTVKEDIVGSDVVVINTCGFIDSAKTEAIDYILQTAALKEQGLVGKILVTGCLSQRYQGDIQKELPEVDGVLGTGSYTEIVSGLKEGDTVYYTEADSSGFGDFFAMGGGGMSGGMPGGNMGGGPGGGNGGGGRPSGGGMPGGMGG